MPDNAPTIHHPQIVMRRDNLNDLPPVSLPEGYTIKCYQPGDDAAWELVIGKSFNMPDGEASFERTMRSDEAFLPERVLFVCKGDEPVATASAWYVTRYRPDDGYLHFVGTLPSETGRGLGLQISLACLHKMVAENRTAAVIQTDDFRIPAIKTYLKLGFRPMLVHENQRQRWRDIFARMNRPELIEEFKGILEGPLNE